ncbi:MAG: cobalamin-dependent protein [Ignavibacteria bacterium]|nr:cobalamin-dependent protein [Ignavibacteria bacterium]
MKVLFVRPKPSPETIGLQHLMIVEPLELEILATLIKDKNEVKIVDMILERKSIEHFVNEFNPDAICLTGYVTHIPVIKEYCKKAKLINKNIITIAGGVHTEKFPEDIDDESIDYRVVRNAVRSFPHLIDFLNGNLPFPSGVLKTNELMNEARLPEYDFKFLAPDRTLTEKYRSRYFYVFHNKVDLMKTSFGCPYHCKFCFCRIITGDRYFARPLNEVLDELSSIKEKEIYIVDDDFLISESRIKEFIRSLKERNIQKRFLVYGRADFIAGHPELIKEFRDAGLRTIIVGLESFEDTELNGFHKQSDSNTNRRAMEVMNRYNVDCYAAVIISPSWSNEDFQKAGDIMLDLGIKFVNLQPLTPLKGTGLSVKDEDLVIKRNDFAKWDLAHVSIRPGKMSLEDFYKNILKLYLRIIQNPKNIISNLKYPLDMQIKMVRGMFRVKQQYKNKIMEIAKNA